MWTDRLSVIKNSNNGSSPSTKQVHECAPGQDFSYPSQFFRMPSQLYPNNPSSPAALQLPGGLSSPVALFSPGGPNPPSS